MAKISIDLGTYNSAAGYRLPDGGITLLKAFHGPTGQGTLIPSFLKFFANGELEKYGAPAYEALATVPELVVWGLKRLIGKSYKNAHDEFFRFSYRIQEAEDGSIIIPIGEKIYRPIELVTLFLQKIKEDCESSAFNPIGSNINSAIITYPAYFEAGQIASIQEAAQKVGFEEIELISEPKAAAYAYRDFIDFSKEPLIMVIDWGAGTLDITIEQFATDETGTDIIDSACPAYGDPKLGGMDIDDALVGKAKEIYALSGIDSATEGKLRLEIENIKILLSGKSWTQRFFSIGGKPYSFKFARSTKDIPSDEDPANWLVLNEVLSAILQKFRNNIIYALDTNGLSPDMIEGLILVGGPMYMLCVRQAIGDVFQDNENVTRQLEAMERGFSVSPLEAVVKGAIIKDSVERGGHTRLPYTYGFLLNGQSIKDLLIPDGTIIANERIIKEGKEFSCKIGHKMNISLYRKAGTSEGPKHFRKGDYKLTGITLSKKPPAYKPFLEIDKNQIASLKMFDVNTQNFALELIIGEEEENLIPEPPIVDEWLNLYELIYKHCIEAGFPHEEADQEAQKKSQECFDDFSKGIIEADRVNELIAESSNLIRFVETQLNIERKFRKDTLEFYERLKQGLESLIPDQALKGPTSMQHFHVVEMSAAHLKNYLKNKEGFQL